MASNERDIRLYMFLRLTMLCSVLVSTVGYQITGLINTGVTTNTYFIIFFTFLVTSAFVFLYEKTRHIRYFLVSQVSYDVIFTTALIYYSGTYDSIFTIFYLFNIIFAAILFRGRVVALGVAVVSGVLYSIVFLINVSNINEDRYFPLLTMLTAFISIALLAGQLVEELRKSRLRISRLERLNEEIVDWLDSGLIALDQDGAIERINRTGLQILGIKDIASVRGRRINETFPVIFDEQGGRVREVHIREKLHRMLVSNVSLPDGYGMIVFRDLTEVLELEERLRRQERLAGVGRLAAGVAHEVRNPIASISGAAQLLSTDSVDGDERQRLVQIIIRESERVDRLVSQLLRFAKPTIIQRESIDLGELLAECVETIKLRPDFTALNANVEVRADEALVVKGSKDELREVISNLLVNAMQALAEQQGNSDKRITVKGQKKGSQIVISVGDNGPGIPKEFKGRVFDPFFTTKSYGTGLGLAQVHKIIRDHDGQVDIDTEVGRGTSLTIRLPA